MKRTSEIETQKVLQEAPLAPPCLRDIFAGLAMHAIINSRVDRMPKLREVAQESYRVADAMLLARKAGTPE